MNSSTSAPGLNESPATLKVLSNSSGMSSGMVESLLQSSDLSSVSSSCISASLSMASMLSPLSHVSVGFSDSSKLFSVFPHDSELLSSQASQSSDMSVSGSAPPLALVAVAPVLSSEFFDLSEFEVFNFSELGLFWCFTGCHGHEHSKSC